ncbi:MAG TPA: hypothetical protein PLC27_05320 [Saprospiraceae bacterium]|jgi:hypothetical protein|nr:hypothetical protein [Saprospiraceae bacterium]
MIEVEKKSKNPFLMVLRGIGIFIISWIIIGIIEFKFGLLQKGPFTKSETYLYICGIFLCILSFLWIKNNEFLKGFLIFILGFLIFSFIFPPVFNSLTGRSSSVKSKSDCDKIEGYYETINEPAKIMITVINNKWVGEIQIRNGMTGEFDSQNSQYGDGEVVGKELFDNGIQVGNIDCGTLYTDFGGGQQLDKVK